MKKLRYVVTGTGRSGTVYLANLLSHCGIPCGHESIFTPWGWEEAQARLEERSPIQVSAISIESCGNWCAHPEEVIADSSYMAAPFLNHPLLQDTQIIHVVREPMQVINSFVVGLNYFQDWIPSDVWHKFIYTHVPELRLDHHPLDRAALYYVRWNQLIEKRASANNYFFCQLENVAENLCRYLNISCPDPYLLTTRTVNSRMKDKPGYRFEDIPSRMIRKELQACARRYGYSLGGMEWQPASGFWYQLWRSLGMSENVTS